MGLGWFSTHYNHFYGYGNKGRVLWLFLQNMYAHTHTYMCVCVCTHVYFYVCFSVQNKAMNRFPLPSPCSPSPAPQPGALPLCQCLEPEWWRWKIWTLRRRRSTFVLLQQRGLLCHDYNRYEENKHAIYSRIWGQMVPGHQARQFYNKQHTLYFPFVAGYKHAKTVELPQQRSSSVATQQTTVSSVPSHPSTAGVSSIDWLYWHTIPRLRQELNLSTYQRCTALELSSSWWCMLHHADDVNPGLRTHWAEAWYKTRWRSNGFTEVG